MNKDEALKLALEALESCYSTGDDYKYQFYDDDLIIPAITAIKKALAQPEQEPVAVVDSTISGHIDWLCTVFPKQGTKLYTTPPPVAEPHKRKPLTDEEVHDAVRESDLDWHQGWTLDDDEPNRFISLARAIEAKLKEKNNA